jgi:uncharacterized protein (TIGR00251 family)
VYERCLRPVAGGCLLSLRVHPGARRQRIVGAHGDALKVEVARPPERGKATGAVLELLAEALHVGLDSLRLVAGEKSRTKLLEVRGLTPEEVAARLAAAVAPTIQSPRGAGV